MPLSDPELWAAALAVVLPPIIAVVNQPRWSGAVKAIFALLVATIVGLGTAYFNGGFNGRTIISCILIAVIVIGTTYHTLWKPSGIAPGIERATSTSAPQHAAPNQ
jgi:Tfp pilus assembly protein PilO